MKIVSDIILNVTDLKKYYPNSRGLAKRRGRVVKAVDGVSFDIRKGETLGLVGESGSGKTTVAKAVLRAVEPTSGKVEFCNADGRMVDLVSLPSREIRNVRKNMQMIFQDPYSSLNPRMRVRDIICEPLVAHGWSRDACDHRAKELLQLVGLDRSYMVRYPHAFSGGQRQRICIARALALSPYFLVADEPVSALDVSVQAQILNLLQDLQVSLGLSFLFISHDLSVVRYLCHRVAVMYVGRIVEMGGTDELYRNPLHPYTRTLMSAVLEPDPESEWASEAVKGEIPDPSDDIKGCRFAPRCTFSTEICLREMPKLRPYEDDPLRWVACHHAEELEDEWETDKG